MNASAAVSSGNLGIRLYEIWDGDWLWGSNVVPDANATSVCAAAPPGGGITAWYAVLAAPNGTNLLTYASGSMARGAWAAVDGGPWNRSVTNGSSLIIVTVPEIHDTGRGLSLFGFENGGPISGCVTL